MIHRPVVLYLGSRHNRTATRLRYVTIRNAGEGWNGAPVDFNAPAAGNDFTQFGAGCHQSPQADANGACPDPAPRCN